MSTLSARLAAIVDALPLVPGTRVLEIGGCSSTAANRDASYNFPLAARTRVSTHSFVWLWRHCGSEYENEAGDGAAQEDAEEREDDEHAVAPGDLAVGGLRRRRWACGRALGLEIGQGHLPLMGVHP